MATDRMHPDQIHSDASLVRRLLGAQFPEWAELPIQRIASDGTENAIYRLGDDMAVRLPLQAGNPKQVGKLEQWLPRLAPHLPLAIPLPLATGEPGMGYPLRWSVCSWLEGEEATLERLADPIQAARTLAEFVLALQRIDPAGGPTPGRHNFYRGVPLAARDSYTRTSIEELHGVIDTAAATRAWETDLNAPAWDGPPVWLHGDLSADNLIAVAGEIRGVIDFGGLGVGDPATDLQPGWNLFSGDSRNAFRDAMDVDDATWRRGRGLTLSTALVALPYYMDTNPGIVRAVRQAIDVVLADHERGS